MDFAPAAVDGVPGIGRLREKSGTAVLCFFMGDSGDDLAAGQVPERQIRSHER